MYFRYAQTWALRIVRALQCAVPCARVALAARIPGSVASRGLVILCGKFTVRFHATFPLGQPLPTRGSDYILAHVVFVTSVLNVTSNDFFCFASMYHHNRRRILSW